MRIRQLATPALAFAMWLCWNSAGNSAELVRPQPVSISLFSATHRSPEPTFVLPVSTTLATPPTTSPPQPTEGLIELSTAAHTRRYQVTPTSQYASYFASTEAPATPPTPPGESDATCTDACAAGSGACATGCTDSCSRGGSDSCACRTCQPICGGCCGPAFWEHRTGAFGEFLYLQPTGADVAFGQPRDGLVPLGGVPIGPVGVVSPTYQPGFRVGFGVALNRCTSIVGSYTFYESQSVNTIATTAPNAIHSFLIYPGTVNAFNGSLNAEAFYDIDFQLADVALRRVWWATTRSVINYSVGARYGQIDQNLTARQIIIPGTTTFLADVNFNGGGPIVGLDGERRMGAGGLFIYGRAFATALTGRVRSDYLQSNTFVPVQATTSWRDDRVVPILESELGLGWQGPRGHLRLRSGYYLGGWFNMVTANEFVQAVQTSDYVNVRDTITFDGLTARVEWLW